MNNILITIKKEIRSIFRDKKALMAMFVYPILIPVMVILYGSIYENVDTEEVTYTIGIDYDLNTEEESIFKEMNINYIKYDNFQDMEKSYKENEIEGYLSYDKKDNIYNIYVNTGSSSGLTTYEIINNYLETYSNFLTNEYLISENIDLDKAYNHFTIEEHELNENNYFVVLLFGISLTYVILSICIATSNMAISTTATEKENGTLETILTFPIKKKELILGKYFSSVIVGFIASLISLIFLVLSLFIGSKFYEVFSGFNINLSLFSILGSIITVFGASIFIGGVALLLTAFARSYKEAQSKISLINMICMIPMFISILEVKISTIYYLIPICNFEQILNDLFFNNINIINILITLISTIIYTVILIIFIIKAYNSEKILFTD